MILLPLLLETFLALYRIFHEEKVKMPRSIGFFIIPSWKIEY